MTLLVHYKNGDENVVDINDWLSEESLRESLKVLQQICESEFTDGSNISESFTEKDIPYWYIYYRYIFEKYSIPYAKYHKLFAHLENATKIRVVKPDPELQELLFVYCRFKGITLANGTKYLSKFKEFINAFTGVLLTFISLTFRKNRCEQVAVWSTYNFYQGKPVDFRIAKVYEFLEADSVKFIRIVRLNENYKRAFRLWKQCDEAVLFTGSFIALLKMIYSSRPPAKKLDVVPRDIFGAIAYEMGRRHYASSKLAVKILGAVFSRLRIKSALLMEPSERGLHEILAAKFSGIPTVALMNGVDTQYFHVHKFLKYRPKGSEVFSPTHFGVWSEGWHDYFIKHSKVIPANNIEVSGHLRARQEFSENPRRDFTCEGNIPRVLWIEEPHLPISQCLPFLMVLINSADIDLTVKLRPVDVGQRSEYLSRLESQGVSVSALPIVTGDIFSALDNADVVVASHSTVVLDALSMNVAVALFQTKKWGDYFDLEDLEIGSSLIAETPAELRSLILKPNKVAQVLFKEHYLSNGVNDGAKWAVSKLTGYIDD